MHPRLEFELRVEARLGLAPAGKAAMPGSEHQRAFTAVARLQDRHCRGPEMNDMRAAVLHLRRRQCDHAATEIDLLPVELCDLVAPLAEQGEQPQDVAEVAGGEGAPDVREFVHAQEPIARAFRVLVDELSRVRVDVAFAGAPVQELDDGRPRPVCLHRPALGCEATELRRDRPAVELVDADVVECAQVHVQMTFGLAQRRVAKLALRSTIPEVKNRGNRRTSLPRALASAFSRAGSRPSFVCACSCSACSRAVVTLIAG